MLRCGKIGQLPSRSVARGFHPGNTGWEMGRWATGHSVKEVGLSNLLPSLDQPDVAEAMLERLGTALCAVGADFHRRGWSLATSSNFSAVLGREPLRLLITASGKDKGRLTLNDLLQIDGDGRPVEATALRPSAETALHMMLARRPGVGAVLHTHSVWATVLSEHHAPAGGIVIEGYEMLKGLAGISTHEHRLWVPIFPNTQDVSALARDVARSFDTPGRLLSHGFLIRGHGLYTWGGDIDEARRHVETFEFLFETVGRTRR
jgi:methylthioribulose-1-phosphate dehydratase